MKTVNFTPDLGHTAMSIEFRHCLIVYRGGEVNLITAVENRQLKIHVGDSGGTNLITSFSGETLAFRDCVFDFSFAIIPPTQGQNITQSILTQSGPSIDLHLQRPESKS